MINFDRHDPILLDEIQKIQRRIVNDAGQQIPVLQDLLLDHLEGATAAFLLTRYPGKNWLLDANGNPILDFTDRSIIRDVVVEFFMRMGAEGQTSLNANGINRSYDTAYYSNALRQHITPVASFASGGV